MNRTKSRRCALILTLLTVSATAQAVTLVLDKTLDAPIGVVQMVYSPQYQKLVLRDIGSRIAVLDTETGTSTVRNSVTQFTDLSISPDGSVVFAADYGGENIGYGTPYKTSYVHRYTFETAKWGRKSAYIAGRIQAVSSTRVLLQSMDQWVTFTNNKWDSESDALSITNSSDGYYSPGFYAGVYYGDFRYVPATKRIVHGNTGSSSSEITAFKLVDGNFVGQEATGTYGSADGYGGTLALSTDGRTIYYGQLAVDSSDVTRKRRVFPTPIYAATANVAFASTAIYAVANGANLGKLAGNPTIYALNPAGTDLWTYDTARNKLRHYTVAP
ncbi:hypothetical protein [Ideonella sp.]|uniref:hypothetical protein n=1 Tax=Ideonella sp. TaxID=1929293 RepID=UPI003BB4FADE